MQKEYLYGIIGLLSGIVLTMLFASNAVNANNTGMMRMMGMNARFNMIEQEEDTVGSMMMGTASSMEEMMESMEGKTGDDFDKAFMEAMIVHHQGAIDMAQQAKTAALHDEIKQMADDIIAAQTDEIEMMREWQKDWGH